MKKPLQIPMFIIAFLIMAVVASHAAAPRRINYQGYLTNPAGSPLTGTYPIVFSLYDAASGGNQLWTETQSVAVDKGIFNVALGSVTTLGLTFDAQYYLDIQVNGEQMSARQPLTSVGYAFSADRAESVAAGSITSASIANYSITNNNLAGGSYSNITGVGTLDTLTVAGETHLATTSGAVGIKTTSPRASLEVGGTDGLLVTGTSNSGTARALGAGVRLHWYPRKGAFRAGMAETTYWDDDGSSSPKLAIYSVGMGYQVRPTGAASTAIGAYNKATGDYSLSLGSYSLASASHSIAIGTQAYASGIYSMAFGSGADTNGHDGAMVIGDDTYFQTAYASSDNQLTMRFSGPYDSSSWTEDNCGTGNAAYRLWTSYPDCTAGVYMRHNQSGWSNYSSRTRKENFRNLDGEELLGKIREMSITEWNYKGIPDVKYIGPMAEEFRDAFHLNGDEKTGINSISIDGVNMAGVQALEKRTSGMRKEMAEMKAAADQRIEALQNQIDLLRAEIASLRAQLTGK